MALKKEGTTFIKEVRGVKYYKEGVKVLEEGENKPDFSNFVLFGGHSSKKRGNSRSGSRGAGAMRSTEVKEVKTLL